MSEEMNVVDNEIIIEGVDLSEWPEEARAVIFEVVKKEREEAAKAVAAIKNEYETLLAGYDENVERLQKANDEIRQVNRKLHEENSQLVLERDEALKVRDNAASQIELQELEMKELHVLLKQYQEKEEQQARENQKSIEVKTEPDQAANLQELVNKAAKYFVKRENWGAHEKVIYPNGQYEVFKRKEVEEKINSGELMPLEAPEVPSFRIEMDSPDVEQSTDPQEVSFHGSPENENTHTTTGLASEVEGVRVADGAAKEDGRDLVGEFWQEAVDRRLAELEMRMSRIERHANIEGAA